MRAFATRTVHQPVARTRAERIGIAPRIALLDFAERHAEPLGIAGKSSSGKRTEGARFVDRDGGDRLTGIAARRRLNRRTPTRRDARPIARPGDLDPIDGERFGDRMLAGRANLVVRRPPGRDAPSDDDGRNGRDAAFGRHDEPIAACDRSSHAGFVVQRLALPAAASAERDHAARQRGTARTDAETSNTSETTARTPRLARTTGDMLPDRTKWW